MNPTGPQELPGEQVISEKCVKAKILKQPKRSKKKSHQKSLRNPDQQTKAKPVKRRNTVVGKITAKKRNNRRKNIVSAEQGTNVYIGVSNTDVCSRGSISYTSSIDKQSCVSSATPLVKNTSTQNKSVDNPDGGIVKQKRNTKNKSRSKDKQKITGKECKSTDKQNKITDKQKITGKEYKSTDKQNESKGMQNNIIEKKCICQDKQNKNKRMQNNIADKEHKSTDKQNGSKEKNNIIGKQKKKNTCTGKANKQISLSGTTFHTNSIPGSTDKQQGNLPRSQQNLENNKSWRSSTGSLVDESGIFTVSQKTLLNSQLFTLNHDSSQAGQTSLKRKVADGSTSVDSHIKKMKIQVHPLDIHASPFISSQPTVPSVSTLFVPGSTVVDSIGKKIYKEGKYESVLSGLPYLSRFFKKLISSADSESDIEDFRSIPSSLRTVQEQIDDQNGKLKSKPGIQKVIKEEKRKMKKEEGKQNTISGGNKGKRKKKRNEEEMEAIVPAPLIMPSVLRRLL
ncbi:hypothetical protein Pcinc_007475 [Petrolisthes cinctipes]|nr:hypothetical protein Pcinc_007475 [Petrolisthes cinctipes]